MGPGPVGTGYSRHTMTHTTQLKINNPEMCLKRGAVDGEAPLGGDAGLMEETEK